MSKIISTETVRELVLFAENDGELYRRQASCIIANLARKMRNGQYDAEKAVKAWGYFADEAAKKYCRSLAACIIKYSTPRTVARLRKNLKQTFASRSKTRRTNNNAE